LEDFDMRDGEMLFVQVDPSGIVDTVKRKVSATPKPAAEVPSEFRPISDAKGLSMEICKDDLHVDHSYQREDIRPARYRKIAQDWSWVACNTISVSQRQDDGLFYILDGQNRWRAACLRGDISTLPCKVYVLPNREAEAVAFYKLNVERTVVSSASKYKDMLVAGYPDVTLVDRTIRATGYQVNKGGGAFSVRCVSALVSAARREPRLFVDVWGVVADLHGGEPVIDRVFKSLFALEMSLRGSGSGFSLLDKNNLDAMKSAGLAAVDSAIRQGLEYHGGSGGRAGADGLVAHLLNKSRRSRQLPSPMATNQEGDDCE